MKIAINSLKISSFSVGDKFLSMNLLLTYFLKVVEVLNVRLATNFAPYVTLFT